MKMASFACENNTKLELPQVEFSGLDSTRHDEKAWAKARAKVARALENYGGFEAVYDRVGTPLRDDLLGRAIPELFSVPELATSHDSTKIPYHGAWFQKKGYPFLSLQLTDPNSLAAIRDYSDAIWPDGNGFFCDTAWKYASHMQELVQIIHRMILESLGLNDHYDSHIESLTYSMRLSKYNDDPSLKKSKLVLPSHKDPNFISIISQHKLEGLEVETFDGHWIHVAPKPHAFVVLLGEAFMAWSNGRFKAPKHHVKMDGFEVRYSMVYSTFPSQRNSVVETPKELVDKAHARLFNPFNYYEYLNFRFSDEGEKHEDSLKTYCGVELVELAA
ncbi:Gibberellin 20 oxidase 1-D [Platanthera guangdongensis]|uniref:Gibberellin 20 oxidase 1-D n=1 Tax=Platanthera guangdongensis TaxID=2320717 RepID=A0ABR2LTU8_9ASPA